MQGLVLAVALNSKRNGLLALLIANNFVEIKGAVGGSYSLCMNRCFLSLSQLRIEVKAGCRDTIMTGCCPLKSHTCHMALVCKK